MIIHFAWFKYNYNKKSTSYLTNTDDIVLKSRRILVEIKDKIYPIYSMEYLGFTRNELMKRVTYHIKEFEGKDKNVLLRKIKYDDDGLWRVEYDIE